jgi:hypothetical protein
VGHPAIENFGIETRAVAIPSFGWFTPLGRLIPKRHLLLPLWNPNELILPAPSMHFHTEFRKSRCAALLLRGIWRKKERTGVRLTISSGHSRRLPKGSQAQTAVVNVHRYFPEADLETR